MSAYLTSGIEALGDPTRLAIFQKLAKRPMAVHQLADTFPISRPAVSQHLKVLKNAGLITAQKSGTSHIYQISPEGVERLREHFDRLWDQAMSAFQESVEPKPTGEKHGTNRKRKRSS